MSLKTLDLTKKHVGKTDQELADMLRELQTEILDIAQTLNERGYSVFGNSEEKCRGYGDSYYPARTYKISVTKTTTNVERL